LGYASKTDNVNTPAMKIMIHRNIKKKSLVGEGRFNPSYFELAYNNETLNPKAVTNYMKNEKEDINIYEFN